MPGMERIRAHMEAGGPLSPVQHLIGRQKVPVRFDLIVDGEDGLGMGKG